MVDYIVMENTFYKRILNVIKPQPSTQATTRILTPEELNTIKPIEGVNSTYPLEHTVREKIIRSVFMLGTEGIPEMPDIAVTRGQWLRRWCELMLSHGQAWVIKYGEDWKTFPSVTERGGSLVANDDNGEYLVPASMGGMATFTKPPTDIIKAAEAQYWQSMREIRGLSGVASLKQETTQSLRASDTAKFYDSSGKKMTTSPIGIIPGDRSWTSATKFNAYQQMRDTITSAYAGAYGLFPHEVGIGQGTKTAIGGVLMPIFQQLRDIVAYIDGDANWQFKYWTVGGNDPQNLMRLGQSGVATVNELRQMLGLPTMDDMNVFPDTAGAPATDMPNNDLTNQE